MVPALMENAAANGAGVEQALSIVGLLNLPLLTRPQLLELAGVEM